MVVVVCFGGYPLISTTLTIIPTTTHLQAYFYESFPHTWLFHIFVDKFANKGPRYHAGHTIY